MDGSLDGCKNEIKVKRKYSTPEHFFAYIKRIALWSLPKCTTGTPTPQLHCQQDVNVCAVQQMGSDMAKGRVLGVGCRVGCPVAFQNLCEAGAGAHP